MAFEDFICFTSFLLIIPPSAIVFGKISQILFNFSIPRPILPFESNTGEKVIKSKFKFLASNTSSSEWVEAIFIML